MATIVKTRIQNKRNTEADWLDQASFIPLAGELIIYEADSTHTYARFKIGDGRTAVNDLPFADKTFSLGANQVTGLAQVAYSGNYRDLTGLADTLEEINADLANLQNVTSNNSSDISDIFEDLDDIKSNTQSLQTQLSNKADDFSLEMYNGNGGVNAVKFMTVNYSTCGSENGVAVKVSMVAGHGNGSSYAFLQDAIFKVTHLGAVSVDNFKYYGATADYSYAGSKFGDIFWVINTTNKIVDFYCVMGQYARLKMTPAKRVTWSTGGTITQHTSATLYSSGTKVWANNSKIALLSDCYTKSEVYTKTETNVELEELRAAIAAKVSPGTTLAHYGITDAETKGAASTALASAKTYADSAASSAATKVKNELLNGAGAAYDTLKELGDLIQTESAAIAALETVAAGKANKEHSHTITANAEDDDVVILVGTAGTNSVKYKATHKTYGTADTTYRSVTVDKYGHVKSGSNPTSLSGYGITDAYTKNEVNNKVDTINASIATKANATDLNTHTGNKSNPHGVTAAQVGAAPSSHGHDYLQNGTVGLKTSDSNEVSFASNANYIYFGYDNRMSSSGIVDTYKFGKHCGAASAADGNIECGSLVAGRTLKGGTVTVGNAATLQYDSTNQCLNFVF